MGKSRNVGATYYFKNNSHYYMETITLPDDSIVRISGSSRESKKKAYKVFEENKKKKLAGVKKNSDTVEEWADKWLNGYKRARLSDNTMNNYRTLLSAHILPVLGKMKIQRVTRDDCQKVINRMVDKRLSSSTVRHVYSVLKQLFNDAELEKIIQWTPVRKLEIPKLVEKNKEPFTDKELKKIYDTMYARKGSNPSWAVLTQFLMETGARRGEGLGLTWDAIRKDGQGNIIVHICKTVVAINGKTVTKETPKTEGSIRDVPISNDLYVKMLRLGKDCDLIFHSKTLNPLNPNNYRRWFEVTCLRARVPYRCPHTLRHSFVTGLINNGESIESVKALTGHTTDKMVNRYSHKVKESVLQASTGHLEHLKEILRPA